MFFIGSALAGAAGVVQGLYFGVTVFNIGFQAGLKAFTAAVLGGIGNITGAAIGGFVIGFIEVLASIFGVGRWSEAAVFTTLVLVLIFRPDGHPRPAAGGPGMTAATRPLPARRTALQRSATSRPRSSSSRSLITVLLPIIASVPAVQRLRDHERLRRRLRGPRACSSCWRSA